MNRSEILDHVKDLITKQRQDVHGNPEDTHQLIADFWNLYLLHSRPCDITASDVAVMMVLFKVARHAMNPKHQDNLADCIGYAAIAAELAQ